jgi:hypothetical protein
MSWADVDREELGERLLRLITEEKGDEIVDKKGVPDPLMVGLTHDEIWKIYSVLVP